MPAHFIVGPSAKGSDLVDAKSLGHHFNEQLRCDGCGTTWQHVQIEPHPCPTPWRNPREGVGGRKKKHER